MTFEDFTKLAIDFAGARCFKNQSEASWRMEDNKSMLLLNKTEEIKHSKPRYPREYEDVYCPHFYVRMEAGGMHGGDCWDNKPTPYLVNENVELKLSILDDFIEKYFPETSFIKYKKISEKVHKSGFTSYEYYGNKTDFEFKYIDLKDIYDILYPPV